MPQPEPWLRGTLQEVPAVIRAVLHALELAKEDIELWCGQLTDEQLNAQPAGLPPVAFQLRHIVRSLDRLITYAEGEQLSPEQIAALKTELDPGSTHETLFAEFQQGITDAERRVKAFSSADLEQSRGVGKKQLPTTVGGLLVHVADHTQRHVGQTVTTAKVVKALT